MKRVALVTGSTGMLGRGLALKLAEEGWGLALHTHRREAEARMLCEEVQGRGVEATWHKADLSNEGESKRLIDEVEKNHGELGLLLHCCGSYHEEGLLELTGEHWLEGLNSTANTFFFTLRACLPMLRRSGMGRVVVLGDSSADRPTARNHALGYHVGKTGVLMIAKSFAAAEARHGVTVNVVSPGFMEGSVGVLDEGDVPAGRHGKVEDVWGGVKFLISAEAEYVTGTNMVVSGGWNLR